MKAKPYTSDAASCRTFIAVPIPPELANLISLWLKSWRTLNLGVRWASEEQLHFTLAFLGDVPDASQFTVNDVCRLVARTFPPFTIRLGKLGMFPPRGEGRVLWIGLSHGDETMQRIQKALSQRFQEAGFVFDEREFVPHLTLGRAKPGARLQRTWLERDTQDLQAMDLWVKEVWVMKSELTPDGAKYSILAQCPLGE